VESINSSVELQVHLKQESEELAVSVLEDLGERENVLITSFVLSMMGTIHSFNPSVDVGWLVKPDNSEDGGGTNNLTKNVSSGGIEVQPYLLGEVEELIRTSKQSNVHSLLLCGPRIEDKNIVDVVHSSGIQVGAWGVAANLELAERLIDFGLDRFTIDNPEQL
jgi:glycerophosphoryl diester phosphodiesterase